MQISLVLWVIITEEAVVDEESVKEKLLWVLKSEATCERKEFVRLIWDGDHRCLEYKVRRGFPFVVGHHLKCN